MTLNEYYVMISRFLLENPELKNNEVYCYVEEPKHSYKMNEDIFIPMEFEPTIYKLDGNEIIVVN